MLRTGTLKDREAIYALICEMERKQLPFDRFSEIYREQLSDKHYNCLVCEQNGTVIGVINLRFEKQLHHSEAIAEILEFAVHPSCRKKGIGKEMLSAACQLAKDAGCIQIEASCNTLRTNAHRFYLREGMHCFHYKFSKSLTGESSTANAIGR